jgi:hypothetical protein
MFPSILPFLPRPPLKISGDILNPYLIASAEEVAFFVCIDDPPRFLGIIGIELHSHKLVGGFIHRRMSFHEALIGFEEFHELVEVW